MFQNTLTDMLQVVNAMRDEGSELLSDMSRDERRAFEMLREVCEDYLNESEYVIESQEDLAEE
jgi:hypothetical protein